MNTARRRLFIALPIEDETALLSLKDVIHSLNKYNSILKIVPQENFHITIKFFGSVDADKAEILMKEFHSLNGLRRISFRIEGIGAFPSADNPSVIWAGMKCDSSVLDETVHVVEQLSLKNGFPPEKRKFAPHLTLARIRREKKIPQELKKFIRQDQKVFSRSCFFKELVLFESILKKTGPEYKKISVIQLI